MSWKKYFRSVPSISTPSSSQMPAGGAGGATGTSSKFSSYLPEVYSGHPNRVQRYYQYDDMDRDSDINAALDTIADFCTQSEEQIDEPFKVKYNGEANETEVKLLKTSLTKWVKINDFRSRLWEMFRKTIKYGDQFFVRDPETGEWLWIDNFMVEMVKVDESDGKEPDEYVIRGLDYNKQEKFGSIAADPNEFRTPYGTSNIGAARPSSVPAASPTVFSLAGASADPRQRNLISRNDRLFVVDAGHVIHLSLSVGMDANWPFGPSILEPIFKTFKQKELLEDAIIIYRVQRAPERRIFYIDTGSMPPQRAKAHIEQIKNEIHQRRIPNRTGGGTSILDASYNPLSVMDDYFFAQSCLSLSTTIPTLDGRTLTLAQIIEEYEAGRTNYVYSLNSKTHEMEPGKIAWAGVTRRNAKVLRITLDSGDTVVLTPDHRVITRDGNEVEAQYLTPGTSLMPLYRFDSYSEKHQKKAAYERFLCNRTGKKKFTHLSVCPKTAGRDCVVHHKDLNSRNNNPDNLQVMTREEHEALHRETNNSMKLNRGTGGCVNAVVLSELAKEGGYDGWADFKTSHARNHKIVSVEWLERQEDTGDITVESASNSHLFALSAGVYVHNSDGRGSKVETLPGGDLVGEIGDLSFFTKKLARGLRIPSSYLSIGDDQNAVSFNDGKIGAAMIQEFRFTKYCMRLQSLLAPKFDKDFKLYLRKTGILIDENLFDLQFLPPQNFTKYRQVELDTQQMQVYTQIRDDRSFSKRFIKKRFLNLTEDEILENERLWAEENPRKVEGATGSTAAEDVSDQGLGTVGVRGGMDMGGGMGFDLPPDGGEEAPPGPEGAGVPPPAPDGEPPPPPPPPAGGAAQNS